VGNREGQKQGKISFSIAIVDWKLDHNIAVANGTVKTVDPIMQQPLRINTKQFLNVIFGPVMQPKLSTYGQSLTAMDLEDKKKVDQDLFIAVIEE
jgi:hypothetical protein